MFRAFLVIFWVIAVGDFASAQDPKEFNQIYEKTYIEISQKDFGRALEIADSLYNTSETPFFRAKSLMLKATLYEQSGDLKKSVSFARKAYEQIKNSDDYSWKTRILGFLATQHRLMSLYTESEKYVNRAVDAAQKIEDPVRKNFTLGFLEQEKAMAASDTEDYKKSIQHFEKAAVYFKQAKADNFLISQNIQFMGQAYLRLEEYDQAIRMFTESLELYGDLPDNYVKGMCYVGLAEAHINTGKTDLAKEDIENAEKVLKNSEYLEVLNGLWEVKAQYYLATNNLDELKIAYAKKDSIQTEIKKQKSNYIDDSYSKLTSEKTRITKNQKIKNYIIIIGILAIFSGLIYFFYYRSQKRSEIRRFKKYIEELKKSEKEKNQKPKPVRSEISATEDSIMTNESEERILAFLEKFEESKQFTKKDISLSWLATYCRTNNKYLSYCINKHKKKDFNNYINELRIEFIILKLINEPIYRKYKIAALANEAGFSSQSKFSTIFKNVTSITPSAFLSQLSENRADDSL